LLTVNREPTYDLPNVKPSETLRVVKAADTTLRAPVAAPPAIATPAAAPSRRLPVSSIPPVSEPAAPKVEVAPLRASAAADRGAASDSAERVAAEVANRSAMRQNAARSIELRSAAGAPGFASRGDASLEGCYRLSFDTTSWLRQLPQQFALAKDSTSGRHLVRSVTPSGALDTIITSADWTASSNGSVVLISHKVASQPVSLRFSSATLQGTAQLASETRFVPIQRTVCR
jgi:hypothetical protein